MNQNVYKMCIKSKSFSFKYLWWLVWLAQSHCQGTREPADARVCMQPCLLLKQPDTFQAPSPDWIDSLPISPCSCLTNLTFLILPFLYSSHEEGFCSSAWRWDLLCVAQEQCWEGRGKRGGSRLLYGENKKWEKVCFSVLIIWGRGGGGGGGGVGFVLFCFVFQNKAF